MEIDATVLKRYGIEFGIRSGYSYYQSLNETNGFQAIPVNPYPGENAAPFNLIASTIFKELPLVVIGTNTSIGLPRASSSLEKTKS